MAQDIDVVVDGATGEGGGQVLRSALSLALVTGRSLRIENIRKRRERPGLLAQHLTALRAAARIGDAAVVGDVLGSPCIEFRPTARRGGTFRFAIGTAGSTTLVAQTLLPALLAADGPSEVVLEGGTHNPLAPPFDAFARAFVPVLRRMGADVIVTLERHGFAPAGGGVLRLAVRPGRLTPLELVARGRVDAITARACVASLPASIAERELDVLRAKLPELGATQIDVVDGGPGNLVSVDVATTGGTEVFTALGRIRLPAERVAANVVRDVKAYLRHDAPVGEHLADQLLLPLALAGGGTFRTVRPSLHTTTNARVIALFVPIAFDFVEERGGTWRVTARAPTAPH